MSEGPSAPKMPEMPEMPALKVKNLAIGGAILVAIWVLVISSGSKVAMGVMAGLTVALAVAAAWVWRFIMKQQSLMKIVQKGAASPEGREAALKELAAAGDKDVMNVVVRAQLEARAERERAEEAAGPEALMEALGGGEVLGQLGVEQLAAQGRVESREQAHGREDGECLVSATQQREGPGEVQAQEA